MCWRNKGFDVEGADVTRFGRMMAAAAAATGLFAGGAASAAPIAWEPPVTITSAEQALQLGGTIQYAVGWTGYGGARTVTLADNSTVTFQQGSIDGTGLVQVTGASGVCGTNCANYFGTSNSGFNTAVGGFAYDNVQTIVLTGLTVGTSYAVQLFSLDMRSCCGHQTQFWQDFSGNTSMGYRHDANQYLVGTFVADAVSQAFTGFTAPSFQCNNQQCTNLNAVVLRSYANSVPEPGMAALLALGVAGVVTARRRRSA